MAHRLSRKAEDDLVRIYERGVLEFGIAQSDSYLDGLERAFSFLAEFPHAARERTEFRNSRAYPYRSHLIFYRLDGEDIFIQRIRHSREDWMNQPEAL